MIRERIRLAFDILLNGAEPKPPTKHELWALVNQLDEIRRDPSVKEWMRAKADELMLHVEGEYRDLLDRESA